MRDLSGVYGGELNAHQHYRDFSYADNGMILWLNVESRGDGKLMGEKTKEVLPALKS